MMSRTQVLPWKLLSAALWLPAALSCMPPSHAYPAYHEFIEKHSGRSVNCAMCHVNDNGPTGDGPGQIGSLTAEQLACLNQARAAIEPGHQVDSPILNQFGNQIIKTIGRVKFIQLGADPGKLPDALGIKSDLDNDGIPDAQEYLDGTNPLSKDHGDPWKLFFINLARNKEQISLTVIAILCLNYGLVHLLRAL